VEFEEKDGKTQEKVFAANFYMAISRRIIYCITEKLGLLRND
jgi:hypothetical protein